MYDIITFGSAAQDIHVRSKSLKISEENKVIYLPLGSKIDAEDIVFSSGGGGTNTAATFAKQGFRVAFCGAIGADVSGLEIIRELRHLRIDTRFVVKKKEKHTNFSVIISAVGQDRTILAYRGASDIFGKKDIKWKKIKKAKWFYLAPLSGMFAESFEEIVDFAKKNNIKVAVNPSLAQLSLPVQKLKEVFKKVDILFLNQEEASFLAKVPFSEEQEVFKKIDEICHGVVVMTKGEQGVVVSDGKYFYSAPSDPERKVVETTGAGDSFAAGFLSDYIKHNGDIIMAIQFGLANSAANISEIGAKSGILEKGAEFKRVQVLKQECGQNNLCIEK